MPGDSAQITFDEWRLADEAARAKRDEVMAEVADDNAKWMSRAMEAFFRLPDGEVGTGEDIRARLLERGLPRPRHPNVWGALIGALAKRGALVATGEWRPMRSGPSHGRKTSVYAKAQPPSFSATA